MNQNEIYEKRSKLFFTSTPFQRGALIFCILLGAATFIAGHLSGQQNRTWGSFLFNLMYFFSFALGGVAFGNMQDIINATWGRPIKRLHESFSSFLPYAAGCFFIFFICIKANFLGANKVYSWIADPYILHDFEGKKDWLLPNFMIIRNVVAIFIILGLSRWHMKMTIERDLALVNNDKDKAFDLGIKCQNKLRYWSSPILVVYSICFSLICFDLLMSLAPTWFSTLWGGWTFSIMMQSMLALILLFLFALKDTEIGQFIGRQQFHDIGKLLHGFTVFFAYLTFSHVLTYWYTNVPEETSYFITRLEKPWIYFIIIAPFLSFVFPFFMLIPKVSKWNKFITIPIALVVIFSQWLSYFLVVMPELVSTTNLYFPWIELGLFVGFAGMFFTSILKFGSKVPMVGIADPLLVAALNKSH